MAYNTTYINLTQTFSHTRQQIWSAAAAKAQAHREEAENLTRSADVAEKNGDHATAERLRKEAESERQQAKRWQWAGVAVNMVGAGLSAPTQSSAGIAANTAAPAASYVIGQEFKRRNAEGSLGHLLAHATLGGLTAAAGGNDPLAGALSSGGAEAAAGYISGLFGQTDGSRLSTEQKETVRAIAGLFGTAAGAALGNTPADVAQGSLNARNSVENNYLTDKQAVDLYTELKNCQNNVSCQNDIFDEYRRKSAINRQLLDAICADNADSVVCQKHIQIAMGGNTEIFKNDSIYYLSAPWKESADDFVIAETINSVDKYFMGNEASSTHATKGTSPGRNLSNIHIGKPMEDTASPINLSNPFSEYYQIVFNEQQRNFIEQTGKSAGTAVLKTLLEPALEVSDLTNAGRNMILGGNEYPTNMSALGDYVQQGAGTGKALLLGLS